MEYNRRVLFSKSQGSRVEDLGILHLDPGTSRAKTVEMRALRIVVLQGRYFGEPHLGITVVQDQSLLHGCLSNLTARPMPKLLCRPQA